jgi:hypothetical protein
MAADIIYETGHADMGAAVVAMKAAIDAATEAIDAALQCDVIKIGSGNWGFWVAYT